ncbi:MAG: amidohydrolase family protein, partial [Myxococcota bacterium]|nr:amidohydrolase family protein [Myxococcota bacterium]
ERLTPAGLIPMHTPEEACQALDHTVTELGFKVTVVAGLIARPLPGKNEARSARWIDSFGPDDPFAYDNVWKRCRELDVVPTFHSSAMGWGSRTSLTNYVHNHLGNFSAAGEATCRSLFLAGVAHRFPDLRFAFLEGGIAWALNLYSDLVGHYEKRGGSHIHQFNPQRVDPEQLQALFERYAAPAVVARLDHLEEGLRIMSDPDENPEELDEFSQSGVQSASDIRQVFERQFFFGCEADDPMTAVAFDGATAPHGAQLPALFSSDIGHWDVPDMSGILPEAWEAVEKGRLNEADFRRFTFQNAVDLFSGKDGRFFAGTSIEQSLRQARPRPT